MPNDVMAMIKAAKNKYKRNDAKVLKPRDGKNLYAIMTNGDGTKFWADVGVHWLKESEDAKADVVIGCRQTVYDEPCPVCQAVEKAIKAQTDDESIKLAKSWKARETILLNVIVLEGPDKSDDPQILELTKGTFGAVNGVQEDWDNPEVTVILERSGRGLDTRYSVSAAPPTKQHTVTDAQREKRHDLYAYIEQNFFRSGDDAKAMASLSGYTGMSFALPNRGAALLTGSSGTVAPKDTKPEETVKKEPEKVVETKKEDEAPATAPDDFDATMTDADIDAMLADIP